MWGVSKAGDFLPDTEHRQGVAGQAEWQAASDLRVTGTRPAFLREAPSPTTHSQQPVPGGPGLACGPRPGPPEVERLMGLYPGGGVKGCGQSAAGPRGLLPSPAAPTHTQEAWMDLWAPVVSPCLGPSPKMITLASQQGQSQVPSRDHPTWDRAGLAHIRPCARNFLKCPSPHREAGTEPAGLTPPWSLYFQGTPLLRPLPGARPSLVCRWL